jgi:hypothetical protein
MKRRIIKDPGFLLVPGKRPAPTVAEQRRLVRERLAQEEADYKRLVRMACIDPRLILSKAKRVMALRREAAYLGAPDATLDLYRLFSLDLPAPEQQVQLRLPLGDRNG